MAKRARGTSRPGQRRPPPRSAPRPAASAGPAPAATETPVAGPVGPSVAAPAPTRTRSREASGTFSASAAQEYAYVRSDLRRIARVATGLFGAMFVLFLLIDVLGVIKL